MMNFPLKHQLDLIWRKRRRVISHRITLLGVKSNDNSVSNSCERIAVDRKKKCVINIKSAIMISVKTCVKQPLSKTENSFSRPIIAYCILTSVDSDKPVQPPFKLRNSK